MAGCVRNAARSRSARARSRFRRVLAKGVLGRRARIVIGGGSVSGAICRLLRDRLWISGGKGMWRGMRFRSIVDGVD
ncbi:hypothetical protein EMCG_09559, partial [[Emmonsia] crescens]